MPANIWDLDLAALNDHPAAVQKVCDLTGTDSCMSIKDCRGTTSFMISDVPGLVTQVRIIVSIAVSLHPGHLDIFLGRNAYKDIFPVKNLPVITLNLWGEQAYFSPFSI